MVQTVSRKRARSPSLEGKGKLAKGKVTKEERDLESLVFGVQSEEEEVSSEEEEEQEVLETDIVPFLEDATAQDTELDEGAPLFYEDNVNEIDPTTESDQEDTSESEGESEDDSAWRDKEITGELQVSLTSRPRLKKLREREGEDMITGDEYEKRLRQQHEKLHPKPSWAVKAEEKVIEEEAKGDEEEDPMSILTSSASALSSTHTTLPSGTLDIERLRDANVQARSSGKSSMVRFHPEARVLAVGGSDRVIRLFRVDGRENAQIQSLTIKDFALHDMTFSPSGTTLYLTGRRAHFYTLDLETGKLEKTPFIRQDQKKRVIDRLIPSPDGQWLASPAAGGAVDIISTSTKRWVREVKINSGVIDLAWGSVSGKLWVIGSDSVVYGFKHMTKSLTWRCVRRWRDIGGFSPTTLAISHNERWFATGSTSGIVHLYRAEDTEGEGVHKVGPAREFLNLTTPIGMLSFAPGDEILIMASRTKRDQLRLVHVASKTVFSNWPTQTTPLGRVMAVDAASQAGFLAIASHTGKVLLYRMKHYAIKQ
ncbi:WD40-repeat-containing domain protein [Piptocephalis cylindrospora]|uniref:WD40-repeat-containing domain protein n=1 Tax=Piptocephalis cylindrospora TaxID=1907219 RepID=A0A4P9Y7Q0_9FUNG|nr:WD40-repeat-containing domain protein [Piptocephalis cylindrospora]|eukprot:RKP15166.1 WD40-repeat-containing domain protein [Piptocephalis cylindrospora]